MTFAKKLIMLRKLRNLRQVELSRAVGLPPIAISLLERGELLPGPRVERQLLDHLGYTPELAAAFAVLSAPEATDDATRA